MAPHVRRGCDGPRQASATRIFDPQSPASHPMRCQHETFVAPAAWMGHRADAACWLAGNLTTIGLQTVSGTPQEMATPFLAYRPQHLPLPPVSTSAPLGNV